MPSSTKVQQLKINTLTEAQYDAAVQSGTIGEYELSVLTDASDKPIQVESLPTASAEEEGNIYQYVGATDSSYTNGYFYKCVSDGQSPATYSWEAVEVQASSGGSSLPDQTGNAGKFLTTDGTDASWSDKTHSLVISGRDNISEGGVLAIKPNNQSYGSSISFYGTDNTVKGTIRYDGSAGSAAYRGIAISPNNYQFYRFCPTHFGTNSDNYFALGASGLRWSKVYTVKLNNGADIDVPTTGGTLALTSDLPSSPATMPELTVAGWSNNTQTVTVTGVTASNVVIVSPAPASAADYAAAGIVCTAQGTDSLTFTCTTVPTNAITVNVVIF